MWRICQSTSSGQSLLVAIRNNVTSQACSAAPASRSRLGTPEKLTGVFALPWAGAELLARQGLLLAELSLLVA